MKLIFVGGCGRSGTTLLQKLLLSHSAISGGSEFYFGEEIFRLYQKMTNDFFLEHNEVYYSKEKAIEVFRNFYTSFLAGRYDERTTYLSEKTPTNIKVAKQLLEVFPESVYINMIRDGRDVLASYLEVSKRYRSENRKTDITLKNITGVWMDSVKLWDDISILPNAYSIRYEDLITEPETTLTKLMNALNLDLEMQQLSPESVSAESVNMQANQGTAFYSKGMMMQPFDPSKIGSWKRRLSAYDKLYSNLVMSNQLSRLGYDIDAKYFKVNRLLKNFIS